MTISTPSDYLDPQESASEAHTLQDELPPSFRFLLTPHRSLSDKAFNITLVAILAAAFLTQGFFLAVGVWVAGVAALFNGFFLVAAFIACRNDRNQQEIVTVKGGRLLVSRTSSRGKTRFADDLALYGLTLHKIVDPEYGCQQLELQAGGKKLVIAGFLSPTERVSFADALIKALRGLGAAPRLTETRLISHPV